MTVRLLLPFCLTVFLTGCGTAAGDTASPADTGDGGDSAVDTGADTADTGADTSETGHDTADTAVDTGDTAVDTGPTIEPLYLEVTNDLDEAIDFLDAADLVIIPDPWLRRVPRRALSARAELAARIASASRVATIEHRQRHDLQLSLPF